MLAPHGVLTKEMSARADLASCVCRLPCSSELAWL